MSNANEERRANVQIVARAMEQLGGVVTSAQLVETIVEETSLAFDDVAAEVKRVLRLGTRNGFIVRDGHNYSAVSARTAASSAPNRNGRMAASPRDENEDAEPKKTTRKRRSTSRKGSSPAASKSRSRSKLRKPARKSTTRKTSATRRKRTARSKSKTSMKKN